MIATAPTALIADDEPLLREALARQLAATWPQLQIVAMARSGREAVELFETHRPAVCFLDVQMPGMNGVEAARMIGRRAHTVFVTAFDQYAVQAFAQGALDYLVKPVRAERLAETVARVRDRLRSTRPAFDNSALLQELAARLRAGSGATELRWLRASVGTTVRLIPVEDVDFLRSEDKYTLVAWHDDGRRPLEAVIRAPLKELVAQLDASHFAQVHRSVVVNLRAIEHVRRLDNETAEIHLKGRRDVLPVSRNHLHLFRQM